MTALDPKTTRLLEFREALIVTILPPPGILGGCFVGVASGRPDAGEASSDLDI
jgi:hypothetical protein